MQLAFGNIVSDYQYHGTIPKGYICMGTLRNRIPELMQRKGLRDNKRYSQKDLAEGTKLTTGAVSRIVNNYTLDNVAFSSAFKIAQWLGVHMEELVVDEEDGV